MCTKLHTNSKDTTVGHQWTTNPQINELPTFDQMRLTYARLSMSEAILLLLWTPVSAEILELVMRLCKFNLQAK